MHTMSHHHTYYVASSHMLCHIIIHTLMCMFNYMYIHVIVTSSCILCHIITHAMSHHHTYSDVYVQLHVHTCICTHASPHSFTHVFVGDVRRLEPLLHGALCHHPPHLLRALRPGEREGEREINRAIYLSHAEMFELIEEPKLKLLGNIKLYSY